MQTIDIEEIKRQYVILIKEWHSKGWSPATSTNYSFRHPDDASITFISRSGIDKSCFREEDFIEVSVDGNVLAAYRGVKPSAETLLHTRLFEADSSIHFIVHSHSVFNTVLSRLGNDLSLIDYELIKAISGFSTHEEQLVIPVFPNSQDIDQLSKDVLERYAAKKFPAYLLSSHGLYTWGKTLPEAKRHLETLEFLLECQYHFEKLKP